MKIKWHLEEAVMLVDLYKRVENSNTDIRQKEIEKLSLLLNNRAKILKIDTDDKFRNINGIIMQLENIHYMDTKGAEGLSGFSKVEEEAYQLYSIMPEIFERIVREFREKYER